MVRPKKNLGQHFLWDKNIAQKMVKSFKDAPTTIVLELGPGKGVLTNYLTDYFGKHFYAVEIDKESIDYLLNTYPELSDHLIQHDFLQMDLGTWFTEPVSIIGNFPYNISSQIFFKILTYRQTLPFILGMVQKEVAERIVSGPGSKVYGKLSVMLQAFYRIRILFRVGPQSFVPPPKVKSAVIQLERNERKRLDCNEELFFQIVKQSFNQRRKILANSLKSFLLNLKVDDERFKKRPEALGVEDFIEVTNLLAEGSEKI